MNSHRVALLVELDGNDTGEREVAEDIHDDPALPAAPALFNQIANLKFLSCGHVMSLPCVASVQGRQDAEDVGRVGAVIWNACARSGWQVPRRR